MEQANRKPISQCPNEWAEFNRQMANITLDEMVANYPQMLSGLANVRIDTFEEPISLEVFEVPGPVNDLISAIQNAASELEGQGEKSDRIARQLIEALAVFAAQTERP